MLKSRKMPLLALACAVLALGSFAAAAGARRIIVGSAGKDTLRGGASNNKI